MATLGERLRQVREERRLSLEAVGKPAGVSKQGVSAIENNKTKSPRAETLEPMCRLLGIHLHWLMTGRGPKYLTDSASAEPKKNSRDNVTSVSHFGGLDPEIVHEAVTLLLFDLDHGGPRSARSASALLLRLIARLVETGGRLPASEQEEFEHQARSRGEARQEGESHERKRGNHRG